MYAAIRRYEGADPASTDAIMRMSTGSVVPMLRDLPGFVAHYVVNAGDGVWASVSIFEDQATAEESTRRILEGIRTEFTGLLPNAPQLTTGEVVVHQTR
jgi:hypothetical protein